MYPIIHIVFNNNIEEDYLSKSLQGRQIEMIKIFKQAMDYIPESIDMNREEVLQPFEKDDQLNLD